jgi:tRNA pseudouridine55 synthase
MNSWIILWKERDVMCTRLDRMVKRQLGKTVKVGHAGTLDPFAEGILPIAFGSATRMIPFILRFPKTYRFVCTWGSATDTEDLTGTVTETSTVRPNYDDICAALPLFTGKLLQRPCLYSAVKVQGVPAYILARKGQQLDLPKKTITIYDLKMLTLRNAYTGESMMLEVTCSSGTYVRALARDLALHLGTLAYVSYLERTSVGPFNTIHAVRPQEVDLANPQFLSASTYPMDFGLEQLLPVVHVTGAQTLRLWNGLQVDVKLPFFSEFWVCKYQENMVCLSKANQDSLIPYRCFIDLRTKNSLNVEEKHEAIS